MKTFREHIVPLLKGEKPGIWITALLLLVVSFFLGKNLGEYDAERKMSVDFEKRILDEFKNVVYVSAKTSDGFGELSSVIAKMYELGDIDISNDAIISSARQFSAVSLALDLITEAKNALEYGQTPDIVCFTLERALSELDMIDARETSEELVNEIFSRFCVGK